MSEKSHTDWQYQFLQNHELKSSYLEQAEQISGAIEHKFTDNNPQFIGICGGQGTGKTTLSAYLKAKWQSSGKKVVSISLDDYYMSKAERDELGAAVHPLFTERGLPGTHNIAQAIADFHKLQQGNPVIIPRFNKACDDLYAKVEWQFIETPVDIIIIEGWCIGVSAQHLDELQLPVNQFEFEQDPNGHFRQRVNHYLAADYQDFFAFITTLVYLDMGDFSRVERWRQQQEKSLIRRVGQGMSEVEVTAFIQKFERLTMHCQRTLTSRADVYIKLTSDHHMHIGP